MIKILFLQEIPCIRTIKTALMLKNQNYLVDCACFISKHDSRYNLKGIIPFNNEFLIENKFELLDLFSNYDLIHFSNAPDRIGLLASAGNKPIIWDIHDLVSSLKINDPRGNDEILEFFLYKKAAGNIYASPGFKDECLSLYGKINKDELISYNYPSKLMINNQKKEKLSLRDNFIHLVYAGSISTEKNNHRNFDNFFKELLNLNSNIKIHIYPATSPKTSNLNDKNLSLNVLNSFEDRLIIHETVSPFDLISELSQYDLGLLPFKPSDKFSKLFIPNKIFEYGAANLNILTYHYPYFKNLIKVQNTNLQLPKEVYLGEIVNKNLEFESQFLLYDSFYKSILEKYS